MEIQEIDVFIDEKGDVRIEVRGVKGKKCLKLTEDLEAALGNEVISREMTPEAQAGEGESEQDLAWSGSE